MSKITFEIIKRNTPISFTLLRIEKKWWCPWFPSKTEKFLVSLNVYKDSTNFYDTLSFINKDNDDNLKNFFKNKFIPVNCYIDLIKRDAKQFMSDDEFFELETGLDEVEGIIVESKDYADYIENHLFKNKNISFKMRSGFIPLHLGEHVSYFKSFYKNG